MNLVRLLRSQARVTQQTLAELAKTSQPTIASYESGTKSPNLATLKRLAASLGLDVTVSFIPRMTREDQRSLAYHHAVTDKLRRDPALTVKRARRVLAKMIDLHPNAKTLFDRWNLWLNGPTEELIARILDPAVTAREMRQVTPFAGLLDPRERVLILKRFRKEYGS